VDAYACIIKTVTQSTFISFCHNPTLSPPTGCLQLRLRFTRDVLEFPFVYKSLSLGHPATTTTTTTTRPHLADDDDGDDERQPLRRAAERAARGAGPVQLQLLAADRDRPGLLQGQPAQEGRAVLARLQAAVRGVAEQHALLLPGGVGLPEQAAARHHRADGRAAGGGRRQGREAPARLPAGDGDGGQGGK
jgi:hypothetical protein